MKQTIQIKRTDVLNRKPSTLQPGELAVNLNDAKLFIGDKNSKVIEVVTDGELLVNVLDNNKLTIEELNNTVSDINLFGNFEGKHVKDIFNRAYSIVKPSKSKAENKIKLGEIVCFSDDMEHVLTQVLITHNEIGIENGVNVINGHTYYPNFYFRSYGLTNYHSSSGVPLNGWGMWEPMIEKRLDKEYVKKTESIGIKDDNTVYISQLNFKEEDKKYQKGEVFNLTRDITNTQGTVFNRNKATGAFSHAEGWKTEATGAQSHVEGSISVSQGQASHAEGTRNQAIGNSSHSEGSNNQSIGNGSHTEGSENTAEGITSHVEGERNKSTGQSTHVEGCNNLATGLFSHAEGNKNESLGDASHVEGVGNISRGKHSHAEGNCTDSTGEFSHTEGFGTNSKGKYSHAEGHGFNHYSYSVLSYTSTDLDLVPTLSDVFEPTLNLLRNSGRIDTDIDIYIYDETNEDGKIRRDLIFNATSVEINSQGNGLLFKRPSTIIKPLDLKTYQLSISLSANGESSHVEGELNIATNLGAHAEGKSTLARGAQSHSEGEKTIATGNNSHAEGFGTNAVSNTSHTEGNNTRAIGNNAHAEGWCTLAAGLSSHAEGGGLPKVSTTESTVASGDYSHAEGSYTRSSGNHSHSEGFSTIAGGDNSHSEGESTNSIGNSSHAEGFETKAEGLYSHSEGESTDAVGQASHAEGYNTLANNQNTHTEGNDTKAYGYSSHAEGRWTEVSSTGNGGHAEGYYTKAINQGAHAEGSGQAGNLVTANGKGAHAEGEITKATGDGAHTEGRNTQTYVVSTASSSEPDYDSACHAEGWLTKAYGLASHAEGIKTSSGLPSGGNRQARWGSHAEGVNSRATNKAAHAEGGNTVASGDQSHAEGSETTASGFASHAGGGGTIASGDYQTVIGKYNRTDTSKLFIIGGGSENTARSNIFAVNTSGTVYAKNTTISRADYAEMFEWIDSNPNNEDRVGYLVQLHGDKIELATGSKIFGIVSATPAVLGNNPMEWHNKYVTDEWGRTQYEDVEIPYTTEEDIPEEERAAMVNAKYEELMSYTESWPIKEFENEQDAEADRIAREEFFKQQEINNRKLAEQNTPHVREVTKTKTEKQPVINKEFDNTREYIDRDKRSEWAPIGFLGKLLIRQDGSLVEGNYVTSKDGIGINSDIETNIVVLKIINNKQALVFIK